MPIAPAGPGHRIRKGGTQLFVFDLQHLTENNERKVWGLASCPDMDREREVILKAAVEESLNDFMALPIMHLNHTERPIGWFTKAEFRGQDLYVEGRIKPTSDCDDVWTDIEKGVLSQWSIYGDRVNATPSCSQDPKNRTEPCVTKALDLYSISLCDKGTAINSKTFAEVVKGIIKARYPWDTCISDRKKEGHSEESAEKICGAIRANARGLGKATDSATNLIHPTTDGTYPKKGDTMVQEPETKPELPMRDAGNGPEHGEPAADGNQNAVVELLTQIVERLQSLEATLGINKADETLVDEGEEDAELPKKSCTKKADQKPLIGNDGMTITKADLGRIVKAEERLASLETRINTIEKSIPKVPEVVVLDPAINKAMAKNDRGNPIEKSAGAANITGFGRLFR